MVLATRQTQTLINKFNNLSINQQDRMGDIANYVLIPFEGIINNVYPQGFKFYIREAKDIDKEYDKLDISVSNAKDIIYNFLSLAIKYGWGCLVFMVETGAGTKNIFRQVEQIHISYMYHKSYGYFVLLDIGKVVNQFLPNPLVVSVLQNLFNNAQEMKTFYDRVISDIIYKAIEGSITNTSLKKIRLNQG